MTYREEKKTPSGMQNIIIWGYDRTNKKWRPLSVDSTGRLIIDPSDLDTRYLKLSGGTMNADIDMDGNDILNCPSFGAGAVFSSYISGSIFNVTRYSPIGAALPLLITEIESHTYLQALSISNIKIHVQANTLNGSTAFNLRKNGATVATISFSAGETGKKESDVSISVSENDTLNWQVVVGGSSGTINDITLAVEYAI